MSQPKPELKIVLKNFLKKNIVIDLNSPRMTQAR